MDEFYYSSDPRNVRDWLCEVCDGTGLVWIDNEDCEDEDDYIQVECDCCGGTGYVEAYYNPFE